MNLIHDLQCTGFLFRRQENAEGTSSPSPRPTQSYPDTVSSVLSRSGPHCGDSGIQHTWSQIEVGNPFSQGDTTHNFQKQNHSLGDIIKR